MAAAEIPADQDTRDLYMTFVSRDATQDHPEFEALVATVTIGDIKILNTTNKRPFVGVAETSGVLGEQIKYNVREGIGVHIGSDIIAEGSTFNTKNADVWFDPVNDLVHDTEADGYWLIGKVEEVQDADGMFTLLKRRFAIAGEGT